MKLSEAMRHGAYDVNETASKVAALENMVADLIGWTPCPFPPEVVREAKRLVGNLEPKA
jgi:hypothetical protein